MKFKIDENLSAEIVEDLRVAGHEANTLSDQSLTGHSDAVILAKVQSEGRVLFTMDKGIGDIRAFPPDQYAGIVLFRPRVTGRRSTLALIRRHLDALLQTDLKGHLYIVSESGIRIR